MKRKQKQVLTTVDPWEDDRQVKSSRSMFVNSTVVLAVFAGE